MVQIDRNLIRRYRRRDALARWVIAAGGMVVILSVVAILVLIVAVTAPLFRGARAELVADSALPEGISPDDVVALGIDRVELGHQLGGDVISACLVLRDGRFVFVSPRLESMPASGPSAGAGDARQTGAGLGVIAQYRAEPPAGGAKLIGAARSGPRDFTLQWSDGAVSLVEAVIDAEFDRLGRRRVVNGVRTLATLPGGAGAAARAAVLRCAEDGTSMAARIVGDRKIVVSREIEEESGGLFGGGGGRRVVETAIADLPGTATTMAINSRLDTLYVGTANGCLCRWRFGPSGEVVAAETTPAFPDRRAITALALVFGDVSLAVGDHGGGITSWFDIREGDQRKLRWICDLSTHNRPVADIQASRRNKAILSLGEDGEAILDYVTTGKQLARLSAERPLRRVALASQGNAAAALDASGRLLVWNIDCPHPEVSWGSLFGRVHYAGYDRPDFIWQSSGTDEPKFSLVPLIFGTVKSTCYAMLFAAPLALLSAIYVSHFTTPRFRRLIKPIVEIMAAVPSVVVGFLVLLWLAPLLGRWIVAVFVSLVSIPAVFLLFMLLWQTLRRAAWARRIENGFEFLVLVPVVLAGAGVAAALAGPVESWLFDGDFRQWLFHATQKPYDQLNSLVVAIGLGFAVIPIIFSISEDALSSIPHELTAASLAVGASRWQTVWRVILPSASPAVFAAMMVGFGRAVGETMIVFMATGNTPILDPSPFNGFRTLSANIAVEMGEAAQGGTLFRILFLCAVLLFLLTFALNTAADLVRQRLRRKYGRY